MNATDMASYRPFDVLDLAQPIVMYWQHQQSLTVQATGLRTQTSRGRTTLLSTKPEAPMYLELVQTQTLQRSLLLGNNGN